jgi:hypothetical protein
MEESKMKRNDTKKLVKEQLILTVLAKAFETDRDAEFFDIERISLPNGKVDFTYVPKPHTQQMLDDAFNRIFLHERNHHCLTVPDASSMNIMCGDMEYQ